MYNKQTGDYKTVRVEETAEYQARGYVPMLEDVYDSGVLLRDMTFAEVRENAKLPEEKARADRLEIGEMIVAQAEKA